MSTVYEIAQHVITGKPYDQRHFQPIQVGSQGFTNYKLLQGETSEEIIQNVRNYVSGKLPLDNFESQINDKTAYCYLAATKVVDCDTSPTAMIQSTYRIREKCLLHSRNEKEGRSAINMINAFSNPPLDKEHLDKLLANEVDQDHPIIKKAKWGEERNNHLKKVYTYCRQEARIMPEVVPLIESVLKERLEMMLKVSPSLPEASAVIYRGCSGAGKSFAIKKFCQCFEGLNTDQVVQSTDNVKNDIRAKFGKIFNMSQVHLLGFVTFKEFSEATKSHYPSLSTLQEGWFNSTVAIEGLFMDLRNANLKLKMRDFDGDYTTLCLRILARDHDSDIAKPTLDWVERSFKMCRESRGILLQSLKEGDKYKFYFAQKDGTVSKNVDPKSLECSPENLNKEIEETKKTLITEEHIQIFGISLKHFLGMTIEEAFTKVREM